MTLDDQLMIVVPDSDMSADEVRPTVDHQYHRRQRNGTRLLVGALTRRTSLAPPPPAVDHYPVQEVSPENVTESSVPRVKKKIKQKRTWDEPEAQASELLQNTTTSKRPDRIKTRRRLVQVPSSSTARALRTATVPGVQSLLQDDPYYDFGKKIRHVLPSSSTVSVIDGSTVVESEVQTLIKSTKATSDDDRVIGAEVDAPQVPVTAVRIRTMQQQQQQSLSNHRAHPNGPRRSTPTTPSDECVFPRFIRRNNKSRSQRDLTTRCMPGPAAESDVTRTTRILSTVVTSVSSVVKGVQHQKKNDTVTEITDDTNDDYQPTPSSGHPKYFRNRYRNITLPEYLEITRVNQRRLSNNNNVTVNTTEAVVRPTFAKVTVAPSSSSTKVTTDTMSWSSSTVGDDSTETLMDGDPTTVDDNDDDSRSLPIDGHPSSSSSSSSSLPPTDLQDFIYLQHNGTSTERLPAVPAVVVDHTITTEARQRRPSLSPSPPRNVTVKPSTEHDVGVVYPDGLAVSTYLLTFLAVVPLVLVIAFAFRLAIRRKKKKVFDSSEYSSEYNRSPLDFNTITSSPITTKLPRVSQHIIWDAEKTVASTPAGVLAQLPPFPGTNSRWEFPRDKLRLQTILGQGNFGQVWKAEADDISGHEGLTRLVAVKMVKEDAASREREDLIRELSIMQHLGSHPNVVTLLGCCTEKGECASCGQIWNVTKFTKFLKNNRIVTENH